MAMLLASIGSTTVLNENVLSWSEHNADHKARPSSPVLRTKLCVTVVWLTPLCRFRPSAVMSRMRQLVTVSPSNGPSSHSPTLVCCIQMLDTTEPPPRAPPIALTCAASSRLVTSPKMAKSYSLTLRLGVGGYLP